MKDPAFITMVSIMTAKLVECETDKVDLEEHIRAHHDDLDEMQRTITDLRIQLERRYEDNCHDKQRWETQNAELYAQLRQLRSENYKLKFGGQTAEETATAYMDGDGRKVWDSGAKIECIKVVKTITEWGLKETKDFCEAYIDRKVRQENEKEESGPGTKRSSQVPAGVGTNLKKSA